MSELVHCQYCGKQCKGIRGLNTHLRFCVNNTDRKACDHCGKDVPDLATHILKCKSNPENHSTICKFCGGVRKDMDAHLAKCPSNPDNGMICPFCNRVHSDRRSVSGHIENCTLNPINKEVHCKFCRHMFRQKRLESHQRRCPLNPDIISCEYCDRAFEKEEYDRHLPRCLTVHNVPVPKPHINEVEVLTRVLSELAIKLKYEDMDAMLRDHDLCCALCYEPTPNKTSCSHPICVECVQEVMKSTPKCPVCRGNM